MKIRLYLGNIGDVKTEGLVVPVDGSICVLGGTAASRALKRSFPPDEQMELFGYLEDDVKKLCPIPHGEARIIPGEGQWEWLVVIAALPHHAGDSLFSKSQFAGILRNAVVNGIHAAGNHGLRSIAMTVIGDSYRISSETSILTIAQALAQCYREDIDAVWGFLDEDKRNKAAQAFGYLNVPVTV